MATIISRDDADKQVIFAVGANYSSNEYIPDGNKGGISLNDVSSGDDATVMTRCIVTGFAKPAGQTWDEGQFLYFDPVAKTFTTVPQTDGLFRGKAYKAALLADVVGDIEIIEPEPDTLALMELVATPTAGNLIEMDATGQGVDSGLATADVQVLTVPAAAGNLAGLDVGGTLTDSGIAAANVQVLTVPAAAGNLAGLDVGGTLTDSGIAAANVQVLAVPVAAGNVAELDATGAIADSGITAGEIDAAVLAGYNTTDGARNSTNTAQAVATSTATDIALEDAEFAGDVAVDVTFKEFTIPVSGVYAIAFSLTFDTAAGGTTRVADLLVNGTSRAGEEENPSGTGPDVVENHAILYLAATDVVKLAGFQDSGGSVNVTAGRLAIQRLQ